MYNLSLPSLIKNDISIKSMTKFSQLIQQFLVEMLLINYQMLLFSSKLDQKVFECDQEIWPYRIRNSKTVSFQTIHQCSSSVFYSSWLVSLHFRLFLFMCQRLTYLLRLLYQHYLLFLPLWFEIQQIIVKLKLSTEVPSRCGTEKLRFPWCPLVGHSEISKGLYGAPTEASLPSGGNPHLKYFVFWSGSIAT